MSPSTPLTEMPRRVLELDAGVPARLLLRTLSLLDRPFHRVRYRGSTRLLGLLRPLVRDESRCVLRLTDGSLLEVWLDDLRWLYLLFPSFRYESSVGHCCALLTDLDLLCIDGGASIGYWSVLLSEYGGNRLVAVEPVESTFTKLQRNCALNDERFDCIHGALTAASGEEIAMAVDPIRHGSSYVVSSTRPLESARTPETSTSFTIDELVVSRGAGSDGVLLKLDVEGSEVQAMEGASGTLRDHPVVLIYEDHGRDRSNAASRFVLDHEGLRCFYMDEEGTLSEVRTEHDVRAFKTAGHLGSNFVATTRGSIFEERLVDLSWNRTVR